MANYLTESRTLAAPPPKRKPILPDPVIAEGIKVELVPPVSCSSHRVELVLRVTGKPPKPSASKAADDNPIHKAMFEAASNVKAKSEWPAHIRELRKRLAKLDTEVESLQETVGSYQKDVSLALLQGRPESEGDQATKVASAQIRLPAVIEARDELRQALQAAQYNLQNEISPAMEDARARTITKRRELEEKFTKKVAEVIAGLLPDLIQSENIAMGMMRPLRPSDVLAASALSDADHLDHRSPHHRKKENDDVE